MPNEDLIEALQLLQGVMTSEDVSTYEKLVRTPKKENKVKHREQLLWENVQSPACRPPILEEFGHTPRLARSADPLREDMKGLR